MKELILFTFLVYVSFITIKFGWLPSISDSWYKLSFKTKPLFWLFCFIIGANLIMMDKYMFQISGIGLWLTGTMAPFKKKWMFIDKFHFIGAYVCIFASLIGLLIHYGSFIPLIGFLISAYMIYKDVDNNRTFWLEVNGFIWAIVGLFLV